MSAKTKPKAIFQWKVRLRDIEPPIWRSVQLPEDTKLPQLQRILEALANPKHPEHHQLLAWRGRFDSEVFRMKARNSSLRNLFRKPPAR